MTNEPNNNDLLQRNMMAAQYQWQDQKLAGQVIQTLQEQLHKANARIQELERSLNIQSSNK